MHLLNVLALFIALVRFLYHTQNLMNSYIILDIREGYYHSQYPLLCFVMEELKAFQVEKNLSITSLPRLLKITESNVQELTTMYHYSFELHRLNYPSPICCRTRNLLPELGLGGVNIRQW